MSESGLTFRELPINSLSQQARAILLADRTPEALASLELALDRERSRPVDRPLLLSAWRGETIVGAALAQRQPGKIALVWPPRVAAEEPAATKAALFRELLSRLREADVQLSQAFPDTPAAADQALLADVGFEHAADLLYMACLEGQFPRSAPNLTIELEAYAADNRQRLLDVLESTYEGTLDCPRLNGVRWGEDVLETYRWTGEFDPGDWMLARRDGTDIGCLLLANHAADDHLELIYFGLVPQARGQGYGRELLSHALWRARLLRRRRLVLSVDAANEPAIALYASAGFVAWDRRAVHLHFTAR